MLIKQYNKSLKVFRFFRAAEVQRIKTRNWFPLKERGGGSMRKVGRPSKRTGAETDLSTFLSSLLSSKSQSSIYIYEPLVRASS
jgi:hypothetical protein